MSVFDIPTQFLKLLVFHNYRYVNVVEDCITYIIYRKPLMHNLKFKFIKNQTNQVS